jgi:hypothetical protein
LLVLGGAKLLEDIGEHRLERLGLGGASDTEEVLSNRERSLGLSEMDDRGVVLEHVDLIDVGKSLHAELLDGRLELLVLRDLDGRGSKLLVSSLGTFATELISTTETSSKLGSGIENLLILVHVCFDSFPSSVMLPSTNSTSRFGNINPIPFRATPKVGHE